MSEKANPAYNVIVEYKMTGQEALAYKMALMYQEEFHKKFHETDLIDGSVWRRNKLPNSGNPMKSNLFRYCWKLLRETRGILLPDEHRLYIRAQIMGVGNKKDAHIEPNILVGDRAWWRWNVYKWLWEKKMADINSEEPPPSALTTDPKIAKELVFTKKFLFEKFDGEPTKDKVTEAATSPVFRFWIMQGKVSKYYIVMSPWMKEHIETLAQTCNFDPKVFSSKVTESLREYYDREFEYEQSSAKR